MIAAALGALLYGTAGADLNCARLQPREANDSPVSIASSVKIFELCLSEDVFIGGEGGGNNIDLHRGRYHLDFKGLARGRWNHIKWHSLPVGPLKAFPINFYVRFVSPIRDEVFAVVNVVNSPDDLSGSVLF